MLQPAAGLPSLSRDWSGNKDAWCDEITPGILVYVVMTRLGGAALGWCRRKS
jgi:hypothetical protein